MISSKVFLYEENDPIFRLTHKKGGASLLNARNIVIIILPNIAPSPVEMWMVAVDYFNWNVAFQHENKN